MKKNTVRTTKYLVKRLVMRSKSASGCQQNASCCQNVPGVKMIVMTSISATYVMTSNSLSHQKIRLNVINTS